MLKSKIITKENIININTNITCEYCNNISEKKIETNDLDIYLCKDCLKKIK